MQSYILYDIIIEVVAHNILLRGVLCIGLAEERRAKGMTQEQLSSISGVSRISIARYESGKVSPTVKMIIRLANALKVPVSKLVDKRGS